ncbi:MAG: hypothetical protein KGK14_05365 [Bacteroidota bacterium]|jgi:hypothetical protein|nr:hypothetical protein [Bacteroidota bacterium]
MPKPHTFPTLYDDLKTVSISFLNKHGYLKPNQIQNGIITWSIEGNNTGSISILSNTQSESPYLELSYKYNDKLIDYRVQLVAIPSNLGKGIIWYFICPSTAKRCKKLYLINTYFYHRLAFKGCMYKKQTLSKRKRYSDKLIDSCFQQVELIEQLYKKNFKKEYAGKPTKKYLNLNRKIQIAEKILKHEIEQWKEK